MIHTIDCTIPTTVWPVRPLVSLDAPDFAAVFSPFPLPAAIEVKDCGVYNPHAKEGSRQMVRRRDEAERASQYVVFDRAWEFHPDMAGKRVSISFTMAETGPATQVELKQGQTTPLRGFTDALTSYVSSRKRLGIGTGREPGAPGAPRNQADVDYNLRLFANLAKGIGPGLDETQLRVFEALNIDGLPEHKVIEQFFNSEHFNDDADSSRQTLKYIAHIHTVVGNNWMDAGLIPERRPWKLKEQNR